jgi:hypothetical protein
MVGISYQFHKESCKISGYFGVLSLASLIFDFPKDFRVEKVGTCGTKTQSKQESGWTKRAAPSSIRRA